MKDKPVSLAQYNASRIPSNFYHDTEDDDFLTGIVPQDLTDTWEEEEE